MALLLAALPSMVANADPFPSRQGSSGLLDVPDAETLQLGEGVLAGELRLDRDEARRLSLGPSPLALGIGLGRRLELGISTREGGLPGDARPSPVLFAAAAKYRVIDANGWHPGFAVNAEWDRINWTGAARLGVAASTQRVGRLRLAAYAGGELGLGDPVSLGPTAGVAASYLQPRGPELVVEGLARPGGLLMGGAIRYALSHAVGFSAGFAWLPQEGSFRASLGIALAAIAPPRRMEERAPEAARKAEEEIEERSRGFLDERPRFRLRMASRLPGDSGGRHQQYGGGVAALSAPRETKSIPVVVAKPETGSGAAAPPPPRPPRTPNLQEALLRTRPDVQRCGEEQFAADPRTHAIGNLLLDVTATGAVERVSFEGELEAAHFKACLTLASKGWTFPPHSQRYELELPVDLVGAGGGR